MAVSEEPPPSHVCSDLQASLTGWGFYPTRATFGVAAHQRSLNVFDRGSWAVLASSCPASKGAKQPSLEQTWLAD